VYLDNPDDAVRTYDEITAQFPQHAAAETAVFRAGMVLFDREQYPRAAQYFERYVAAYPQGASRSSAEFLLQQSRSKSAVTPPPVAPTATPLAATRAPVPPPAPVAATPVPAVPPPSLMEVRVRIMKGHDSLRIDSDGALIVTPAIATGPGVQLLAHNGEVTVNGRSGGREVTIRSPQPLAIRAGATPHRYRGSVTVRADGGVLQIINHVGIEDYLYGVVTKESAASWPLEALKAQAIASRTYALYQAQHRQDREYDMVDDEGSQVYGGVDGESRPGRRAVDETRGVILTYRGRPIYAMFTANSGWYTADPAIVFDQPLPYLIAEPDPYSSTQQMGRWTRRYSAAEIRQKLADISIDVAPIRAIEAKVTCPSGRIIRANIVDDRGAHVMRMRPTLGRALKLPEILLSVQRDGDHFVFTGGGFGHGVGLSQWGAKAMADKDFSAKEILAFYYHGAELTDAAH